MKTMNYSFIRTLCALVVGLMLVLWPDVAADYIVTIIGVLFLVPGIISVTVYFTKASREESVLRFPLEGVGSLLFGLWLVVMPAFFADVLMFLLGFVLMLGAVHQIASLLIARRWMRVPAGYYVVPVLILLAGLVSLFNPTGARNTVFIVIGISSLIYAGSELLNWFIFSRRRPKKSMNSGDIEDAKIIK